MLAGHSAATAEVNWSPSHKSVIVRCFDVVFYRRKNNTDCEGGEGPQ